MLKRIVKEVHILVWIKQFILAPNKGLTKPSWLFLVPKRLVFPIRTMVTSHVLAVKTFPNQSCLQDCLGWKMPSFCDVAAWFCKVIFASCLFVIPFANDISIYKVLCFEVLFFVSVFSINKTCKIMHWNKKWRVLAIGHIRKTRLFF